MVLFPEPTDYENIINAVKTDVLPLERLKDAVKRVLKLKDKARLKTKKKCLWKLKIIFL